MSLYYVLVQRPVTYLLGLIFVYLSLASQSTFFAFYVDIIFPSYIKTVLSFVFNISTYN